MITLDSENLILNPAVYQAKKNARLGQLKKFFRSYYGFMASSDITSLLALRQAGFDAQNNELGSVSGISGERRPTSAASVAAATRDLDIKADPVLSEVFNAIMDSDSSARYILSGSTESIKAKLDNLFIGNSLANLSPEEKINRISRCIGLHFCSTTQVDRDNRLNRTVYFNDLDDAVPILDSERNEEQNIKRRIAVARMTHPLLLPGEKNAELLSVFFNGMPTLELTRATPVLNVKFYSSRQAIESNKLSAITLQKFVEGSVDVGEPTAQNAPLRAYALASQVPTGSVGGPRGTRQFDNFTVTGLELFTAPQTLQNIEASKQSQNYLTPVIDPFRPLASLKSLNIDVKSAYGLQGTRTATLEIVLHDRSRMAEFADFIKPDRFGETFIEIEYGWSHPDQFGAGDSGIDLLGSNPYADLLNLTRSIEHYTVVTSNFNFDELGQVNISLNLIGRGAAESTELSIAGPQANRIQSQIKEIEKVAETINRLSGLVFPPPPENTSNPTVRRREIRGLQGLSAAGDATKNLILTRELMTELGKLREELSSRVNSNNPTLRSNARTLRNEINRLVGESVGSRNLNTGSNSLLRSISRTINEEIRQLLNGLNPGDASEKTKENQYNDSFLKTIPREIWNKIKDNLETTRATPTGTTSVPAGQLYDTGNDTARAGPQRPNQNGLLDFTGTPIVSLGTLITAFVAKPLAALKNSDGTSKFDEVQLYFYNFNNKASHMSHCNISQFPVSTKYFTREYGRMRMESVNRSVNMSVNEFMNFVSTKIVDDVLNPAYGINDLYAFQGDELVARQRIGGGGGGGGGNRTRGTGTPPAAAGAAPAAGAAAARAAVQRSSGGGGGARTFDSVMYNRMVANNVGRHPDFVPPQLTFEIEAVPAGSNLNGKSILKIHAFDKACSPNNPYRELLTLATDNVLGTMSAYPGDSQQREANEQLANQNFEDLGNLRQNWRDLHNRILKACGPVRDGGLGLITETTPAIINGRSVPQYRFVGGAQQLKQFLMRGIPHIIYGAMGTTIKTATVGSQSDPALNTINMQRSLNASPLLPNGQQVGGVPLSVYPVELNVTCTGCTLLRYGQELFFDYNTNTSIDNIYYITGLQHKIEAGSFETTIKFTAVDSFGRYRSLISQLNTAQQTLADINNAPAQPNQQQTNSTAASTTR